MMIFGTILPYIGWKRYTLDPDKFFELSMVSDEDKEDVRIGIEMFERSPDMIILQTFEMAWLNLGLIWTTNIRMAYK